VIGGMRAKKGNKTSRQKGRKSATLTTKVLYVEHDDDNLYMLKTRLERRGDSRFSQRRSASRAASWP